jgi:hypothetical protein
MKEKPEEFANTPVVLTIEEVKTMMVDVMKDQADYTNLASHLKWDTTYMEER